MRLCRRHNNYEATLYFGKRTRGDGSESVREQVIPYGPGVPVPEQRHVGVRGRPAQSGVRPGPEVTTETTSGMLC
jgi:hypothetical protein